MDARDAENATLRLQVHTLEQRLTMLQGMCRQQHEAAAADPGPIDMVLFCPKCHLQHIDRPEPIKWAPIGMPDVTAVGASIIGETNPDRWTNPPHKSHLCVPADGGCGHVWRPADVPTNGVLATKTHGKHDSP